MLSIINVSRYNLKAKHIVFSEKKMGKNYMQEEGGEGFESVLLFTLLFTQDIIYIYIYLCTHRHTPS